MREKLALFPLGTVLYPGLVLPLHVFEDRYRQLVRDLMAQPEPRQFGVVAIRKGRETGVEGVSALYDIGCTAVVREVSAHEDGRFDLVTVGTQRFRLHSVDRSAPYLQGEVEPLPEITGDEAVVAAVTQEVRGAFGVYLDALAERGNVRVHLPDLPEQPVLVSYLVAASMVVDLMDKQALLAAPDAVSRLTAERALLTRETTILNTLTSTPATDLRYSPYNPN